MEKIVIWGVYPAAQGRTAAPDEPPERATKERIGLLEGFIRRRPLEMAGADEAAAHTKCGLARPTGLNVIDPDP